jgi:phosphoribosylaminoimidazole-succinocarboxamide synthase
MSTKFYPGQTKDPYVGKVRTVSAVGKFLVAVTTNRISAFDKVLPFEVPLKGAVLNLIAAHFMKATEDIAPNCLLGIPHPRVAIWRKTLPFKFEVIVRAYNTGSFYRNYTSQNKENPWGYELPELKKNERLPFLMVTPTTKAEEGRHDEDISSEEIVSRGLATQEEWDYIHDVSLQLFQRGEAMARELGLILVDTKYEFGKDDEGVIYLIDEVHTPDSSRYFIENKYMASFLKKEEPRALSKEFLRQWLIDHGFQGNEGDVMPEFSPEFIQEVSDRYVELYEKMGLNARDLKEDPDGEFLYNCVCDALDSLN